MILQNFPRSERELLETAADGKPFPLATPRACRIPVHLLFRRAGVHLTRRGSHFLCPGEIMKTNHLLALVAGGLLLAGTASAQEKKIKRSDLPPADEKTVEAESAGDNIRVLMVEKEKGQIFCDAEMIVNGHSKDVFIASYGPVVEVEEKVT